MKLLYFIYYLFVKLISPKIFFEGILLTILLVSFQNNCIAQSGWFQQTFNTKDCRVINFPSTDTGYILQWRGNLFKTTDRGNSWFTIDPPMTQDIGPGRFSTSLLGVVFGIPSRLTTNGGSTWSEVSNDLPGEGIVNINDQQFVNSNTGYYAGVNAYPFPFPCCYDGVVFKTTDAGLNWNVNYRVGGEELHELYFKDENNGIVLGVSALVYTTNGSLTWYRDDVFYNYVRRFTASSMTNPFNDTIYVSGERSDTGVIIKTNNRGDSWFLSFQLQFKSKFRNINFVDNNVGYAVGDTGLIVKTTNGGENWIVLNSGTRKRLNGVSFINKDTGFVVGDSGLVLTTITGGLSGISQGFGNVPLDFTLHQNFPNPFNPTTTIVFEISKSHFVRLRVFDNNGKEIKTLINEYKTPGKYSIQFESDNLPSGVYFYKLEVNDFSEIKRMVILK